GKMRRKLKLAITALVLVFSLNLMQPVSAAIDDGTQITEILQPAPVQNLKAQLSGPTQVKLTWDPSEEADGYLVYRKAEGEEAFSYRYMVEDPGFIDSTAKRDVYNFYRIYPYILDDSGTMVVGGSGSYVYAKPVSGPEP